MQRTMEDLEMYLEELKLLLKEIPEDKKFIPVTRRHINRFIKSLERLQYELENQEEPEKSGKPEDIIEEDGAEAEIVTVEVALMAPEITELPDSSFPMAETEMIIVTETEVEERKDDVTPSAVLGERLRPADELSRSFSLNDTFRFSRELFQGDRDEMNRILMEISGMSSLHDVIAHLSSKIEWDEEDDTVKDFIELLKKYFV